MSTKRAFVDYALQRRALLAQVARGLATIDDVCDASPYLVRAAKFHGVPTTTTCPMCRKELLTHVFWIYGDQLGARAGSARSPKELDMLASELNEFSVYQVEVCRTCSWNHLIASFMLGDAAEPQRSRRAAR